MAAAGWEDAIYNLSRPHKSLRIDMTGPLGGRPEKRWKERAPAMAAGLTDQLTDQVWSVQKLLRTVPTTNTQGNCMLETLDQRRRLRCR